MGMLVCLKVTPKHFIKLPKHFASTHLYSWVERGIVKGKSFAYKHNNDPNQVLNSELLTQSPAHQPLGHCFPQIAFPRVQLW